MKRSLLQDKNRLFFSFAHALWDNEEVAQRKVCESLALWVESHPNFIEDKSMNEIDREVLFSLFTSSGHERGASRKKGFYQLGRLERAVLYLVEKMNYSLEDVQLTLSLPIGDIISSLGRARALLGLSLKSLQGECPQQFQLLAYWDLAGERKASSPYKEHFTNCDTCKQAYKYLKKQKEQLLLSLPSLQVSRDCQLSFEHFLSNLGGQEKVRIAAFEIVRDMGSLFGKKFIFLIIFAFILWYGLKAYV